MGLFTPSEINISERNFKSLQIDPIIGKIITYDGIIKNRPDKPLKISGKSIHRIPKSFSARRVSINQATRILRDNGIRVDEDEAVIILDFLYLLANSFKKADSVE